MVGQHLQTARRSLLPCMPLSIFPDLLQPADALGCTLELGNYPCLDLWKRETGPHTVPRSTSDIHIRRSFAGDDDPDLVLWSPADVFRGFDPSYARSKPGPHSTFRSATIRAEGRDIEGCTVRLRSADPRYVSGIDVKSWAEVADDDLQALADGSDYARCASASVPPPSGSFEKFQPCQGLIEKKCRKEWQKTLSEGIRTLITPHLQRQLVLTTTGWLFLTDLPRSGASTD